MEKHQNSPKERVLLRRPHQWAGSNEIFNQTYYDYHQASSPSVSLQGRALIRPNTAFARAVVMGNEQSSTDEKPSDLNRGKDLGSSGSAHDRTAANERPMSNLSVLMNQQSGAQQGNEYAVPTANPGRQLPVQPGRQLPMQPSIPDEADSASGPHLGSSAPTVFLRPAGSATPTVLAPPSLSRRFSSGLVAPAGTPPTGAFQSGKVRRCMSSKELGTLAPPSGSPYAYMLNKKEELENSMRLKLQAMRESAPAVDHPRSVAASTEVGDESSSTSSRRKEGRSNESRNRRRAMHNQAVVNDLCEVVADLFIAESKLLKPVTYGVSDESSTQLKHGEVVKSIHQFVSALPPRYALGADTPSEVLLHMRLMAASRAEVNKVAVHILNLEDDSNWSHKLGESSQKHNRFLRLVSISCNDANGLLEYITKLLGTGGSRVLDADVMLSTDGIVLDRFVVEMSGRLRLDMVANLIEAFLKEASAQGKSEEKTSPATPVGERSPASAASNEPTGPLYFHPPRQRGTDGNDIREEMQSAVPLTEMLASSNNVSALGEPGFPKLRRMRSMPATRVTTLPDLPNIRLAMRRDVADGVSLSVSDYPDGAAQAQDTPAPRGRRPLVNRRATADLDIFVPENERPTMDYVTIPSSTMVVGTGAEDRTIPLIPFDELMLIETLGSGRVSTIYRAAWQRKSYAADIQPNTTSVQMVALKVAMTMTGDTSHVDELRREADIASRLAHPNICDLVGVAADSECFCLAYDYCEGGSLLSLLTDMSRYYEYLPIALDLANGMAYLHSRNVIHRDLKPSNILLTRDHRAKIADFGMSIANAGQELTAETGTYRYMAPEVIRHESYSSNADVYSFGICLWQLVTREIPFATMTPIQAAYAVAEGRRPTIPPSTPRRLQEIMLACWDQDSHKRPSFTYIAMALADYAKMAFSPANVGALTLQIANEMLATVEGNSTVNVDFTTPVSGPYANTSSYVESFSGHESVHSNLGLEIE